jgi:hypothetical protein
MAHRTLFYRRAGGLDALSVDSWYLIQDDDRSFWVEHAWTHADEAELPGVGSETMSIAQVLLNVEDVGVLACFRTALEGTESKRSLRS